MLAMSTCLCVGVRLESHYKHPSNLLSRLHYGSCMADLQILEEPIEGPQKAKDEDKPEINTTSLEAAKKFVIVKRCFLEAMGWTNNQEEFLRWILQGKLHEHDPRAHVFLVMWLRALGECLSERSAPASLMKGTVPYEQGSRSMRDPLGQPCDTDY